MYPCKGHILKHNNKSLNSIEIYQHTRTQKWRNRIFPVTSTSNPCIPLLFEHFSTRRAITLQTQCRKVSFQ